MRINKYFYTSLNMKTLVPFIVLHVPFRIIATTTIALQRDIKAWLTL